VVPPPPVFTLGSPDGRYIAFAKELEYQRLAPREPLSRTRSFTGYEFREIR
jgi:hypothetical protein